MDNFNFDLDNQINSINTIAENIEEEKRAKHRENRHQNAIINATAILALLTLIVEILNFLATKDFL